MIVLSQLKFPLSKTEPDFVQRIIKELHIKKEDIKELKILKKSIDARKKQQICYIYSIGVELKSKQTESKALVSCKVACSMEDQTIRYQIPANDIAEKPKVVIIGFGPAGMFAAYFLSLCGFAPTIIERGKCIDERVKEVERFWTFGTLHPESNVQFGEGGAGTFSDGKLNTMVKDTYGRIHKVLQIFVEHGAPAEILYDNKPHIGTDCLRSVIKSMREKISSYGAEFRFRTKAVDIIEQNQKIAAVVLESGEILPCDALILAIGHSARDTFEMLYHKNVPMEAKPMAVGLRIEHPRDRISKAQYGSSYPLLPPADYKLTYQTSQNRGVYSFCMCPGGYIVNASSESGHLAINGMSNYKRDAEYSNSALVVTVTKEDYEQEVTDRSPLCGMYYQRKWEREAYLLGEGKIPVQTFADLSNHCKSDRMGEILPKTKGLYQYANLWDCLPSGIINSIIEAMPAFGNKIEGFTDADSIFAGVETRTSSPVRILRNEKLMSDSIYGLYPCGEGAGYAGGITSAAIDGIKVFEAICNEYKEKI